MTSPRPNAPMTAGPAVSVDVAGFWRGLHTRHAQLAQYIDQGTEFRKRLDQLVWGLEDGDQFLTDDNLFVLTQTLYDPAFSYSASNALLCAFVCRQIAPRHGLPPEEIDALVMAALAMNLGMARLQDTLALQGGEPSDEQREEIRNHPRAGVSLLKTAGLTDPLCLHLVEDHHEAPDGSGYPAGKTQLSPAQGLLRMADLYVARISARRSRRGLAPSQAMRDIYLASVQSSDGLGALFVKSLGMYPPGTYVQLKTGELAVVVHRGTKVNTPRVAAITDASGVAISSPQPLDCELGEGVIETPVSADDVKVQLSPSSFLRRLKALRPAWWQGPK